MFNYLINETHYPGSHWYHAHWHGSTALHVNGGLYGFIKMLANQNISNLTSYEPQIPNENDHTLLVSFLWVMNQPYCENILNDSSQCGFNSINSPGIVPDYVHKEGTFPFIFAVESYCFINCRLQSLEPTQYKNSNSQYNVRFDPNGLWQDLTNKETFLVNGQSQVN